MLTVRPARPEDASAIVKLERYCFPPEISFGYRRWRYLLTRAKGRVLLLQDHQDRVMGYLCLLEHKGWNRLIVQSLAIRWTIRRQGWAQSLLGQVIREGQAEGWGSIRLEVGEANLEARALYHRLGFRSTQRLPDYYGPGQHAYRLVLSLASDSITSGYSGNSLRRDAGGV